MDVVLSDSDELESSRLANAITPRYATILSLQENGGSISESLKSALSPAGRRALEELQRSLEELQRVARRVTGYSPEES